LGRSYHFVAVPKQSLVAFFIRFALLFGEMERRYLSHFISRPQPSFWFGREIIVWARLSKHFNRDEDGVNRLKRHVVLEFCRGENFEH